VFDNRWRTSCVGGRSVNEGDSLRSSGRAGVADPFRNRPIPAKATTGAVMAEAGESKSDMRAEPIEESRGLSVYKLGQGYYTRMGTVIFVALVAMLGILWAWDYLKGFRIGEVNELYVAASGAILIGGVITFFTYLYVFVKPKSVDFLIATEGEMKKVNWSTRREVIGSTTAVITTAFVLTVFCYVIDIAFVALFQAMRVLDS